MLDQTQVQEITNAIYIYYNLFKIDPSNTYCQACINQYYLTGQRNIGFHSPDYINDGQEICLLWSNYTSLTQKERTQLQMRYDNLPSVTTSSIIWPEGYGLNNDSKESIAKMLSVCYVRRKQIIANTDPLVDLEPATIPEMDWLFSKFPNAIYIAVQLGKLIPKTTLYTITKLYLITDPQRGAMLN